MNDALNDREFRLQELVTEFCNSELIWLPPFPGEREPEYTKRALYPQFKAFVESLSDKNVRLLSDGTATRPTRVILGNEQNFYPDISIELHSKRSIAVEVKLLSESGWSDPFSKALGQGLVYSTFGYSYSHVLLVCQTGDSSISTNEFFDLNEGLSVLGVSVHSLHAK